MCVMILLLWQLVMKCLSELVTPGAEKLALSEKETVFNENLQRFWLWTVGIQGLSL